MYVGIGPDTYTEARRLADSHEGALRRWEIQRRLGRQWAAQRTGDRAYHRDFDGTPPTPPIDRIQLHGGPR